MKVRKPAKPPQRSKRRWLSVGLGAAAALALAALAVVLAAEHTPGWYVPVHVPVDQGEQQRVRDSLAACVDRFRAGLAAGQPFDFHVSDRTVTEWLVARGDILPESSEWLPRELHDPVVRFMDSAIIVAARGDYRGWDAIVSARFEPQVGGDEVTVRLASVSIGSLPVPETVVGKVLLRRLAPHADDQTRTARAIRGALQRLSSGSRGGAPATAGLRAERWRLSDLLPDADLRLLSARVSDGELVLRVQPLERPRGR